MHVEEAFATWHLSIILISLRVDVAHISDFFYHTFLWARNTWLLFLYLTQSCKSAGLFGSGSGQKLKKILGLIFGPEQARSQDLEKGGAILKE